MTDKIVLNMQSPYFAGNIRLLQQRQPEIIAAITGDDTTETDDITVIESKTGVPTIKIGDILLHSMYDPAKEARRFVDGLTMNEHINVAVLGLGLGYHIKEILQQSQKRDFILVIEKDPAVLRIFLEQVDLKPLYTHCKLYFAVGKTPMEIFRALQGCSISMFANGITVVQHPASIKRDPSYYNIIGEKIKDTFQWARVNTVSQIKASENFAHNIFQNMPAYLNTPGICTLFGALTGVPGIIVSAGPSLNKNIRYLKQAQGKAVIIAVDTALRVLLRHGIEPDMVVSIDYTPHNARYFEGISTLSTALVVDPEVYPDIIYGYNGPKFMISLPGKSLCDWLAATVHSKGDMEKGLSVAHTALLLAIRLGLTPVGLVGQDLSFPGNMTHVRGASMVRKSGVHKDQKDTAFVQDIFGGRVLTTTSMQVFIKHFEELIDKHAPEIYDLTEGGAHIQGAIPIPLKEYIINKATDSVAVKEIITNAYHNGADYDLNRVIKAIDDAVKGLSNLKNICNDGIQVLKKIDARISNPQYNQSGLDRMFRDWARISRELHTCKAEFRLLGNNITDIMVLQAKRIGFSLDEFDGTNTDRLSELITKDTTVYTRLQEQCDLFITHFERFKQSLDRTV